MKQLRQLAEILHTIYCEGPHSADMIDLTRESNKCTYYLENSLSPTWEQKQHIKWTQQAQVFDLVADDYGTKKALDDIIKVYQIYTKFKAANEQLATYIRILLEKELCDVECEGENPQVKNGKYPGDQS